MIVRIKEDDPRFDLKAGELYNAERYWLDPNDKVTLLERVSDGWNPMCNCYWHQVERVTAEDMEEK